MDPKLELMEFAATMTDALSKALVPSLASTGATVDQAAQAMNVFLWETCKIYYAAGNAAYSAKNPADAFGNAPGATAAPIAAAAGKLMTALKPKAKK